MARRLMGIAVRTWTQQDLRALIPQRLAFHHHSTEEAVKRAEPGGPEEILQLRGIRVYPGLKKTLGIEQG